MPEPDIESLNSIFDPGSRLHREISGDPFRLRIQKCVAAAMEQITVAHGFKTDIAGVHRGFDTLGEECDLPCINILEDDEQDPKLAPTGAQGQSTYLLTLQGFVEDTPKNPTDPAHVLMADMLVRLAMIRIPRGRDVFPFQLTSNRNTIVAIRWGTGLVRPPSKDPQRGASQTAFCFVPLYLQLAEDFSAPYG